MAMTLLAVLLSFSTAQRAFTDLFANPNPPAAFETIRSRYECVTLQGVRVDNIAMNGDDATVDLTVDAVAELPLSRAQREFPPHWTLQLRRDGDEWRVREAAVPEAALAQALADAADASQRLHMLSDRSELVDGELVRQLLEVAFMTARKSDYERSAEQGELALRIAEEVAPAEMARAEWIIGRAHDSANDTEGSAAPIAQAIALAKKWNDRDIESRALVLRGWSLYGVHDRAAAKAAFHEGIEIAEALHADRILDEAYLGLGAMALDLEDDYINALRNYDLARVYAARSGDRVVEAAALGNLGIVHQQMAHGWMARSYLQRAVELYRAAGNTRGVMRNLRNLADVELASHDEALAWKYVHEVDAMLLEQRNDRTAAFNDETAATLLLHQRHYAEAEKRNRKARAEAALIHDEILISHVDDVLGDIRFEQHRYREALDLARETALRARTTVPDFNVFWESKMLEGRSLQKLGHPEAARAVFVETADAIEARLDTLPLSGDEKRQFFEDKIGPYEELFALAAIRGNAGEALRWSERDRGRALLASVVDAKVRSSAMLTSEERREEQRLDANLAELNIALRVARMQRRPDGARIAELEHQLQTARLEREALTSRLYRDHPELSFVRGALPLPTLDEIRRDIPADGAIVDYVVARYVTWIVVITRNGPTRIRKIAIKREALSKSVERFADLVSSGNLAYRPAARRLYDLLIAPVAPALQGKKIVCFIPNSELWRVPFQALIDPAGRHFVERYALFYAPSLALLSWYEHHQKRSGDARTLLAVGNPQLSGDTEQMARAVHRDESLAPLPDAEREARGIARFFDPRSTLVLTGAQATETRLKREIGRYRIMHFATHGIFDDVEPLYSHIALSRAADEPDDGLLEARELAELHLNADLVVLSGCDTGRGLVSSSDGIIGMSWALMAAGCPRSIVTLWKIGSSSAGDLMIDFHRHLAAAPAFSGRTASEALRKAQLEMIGDKARRHPFYWGGFILIGYGWP